MSIASKSFEFGNSRFLSYFIVGIPFMGGISTLTPLSYKV